jgi:hypothetical protein
MAYHTTSGTNTGVCIAFAVSGTGLLVAYSADVTNVHLAVALVTALYPDSCAVCRVLFHEPHHASGYGIHSACHLQLPYKLFVRSGSIRGPQSCTLLAS